jgi:hypothetical protein
VLHQAVEVHQQNGDEAQTTSYAFVSSNSAAKDVVAAVDSVSQHATKTIQNYHHSWNFHDSLQTPNYSLELEKPPSKNFH